MIELGRYRIAAVQDGTFAFDGGAMFGIVPKPLWEKQFLPDARNRIRLAARCLLVIDRETRRRILVDDGMGDAWDEKQREIYAIEKAGGRLCDGLQALSLSPNEITDVILTHLHFDHAGGTTVRDAQGQVELAFPNADYHLQRRHWQWAHAPSERDAGSFIEETFELLQRSNRLHLLDGEGEIFPDIELIVSEGHTVALQLPRIHCENTHLTFCGDLVPTRAHIQVPWGTSYDLYPLTSIEEKKMMLAQALEDGGTLVFGHDAEVAACRLGERDGAPVFQEVVAL